MRKKEIDDKERDLFTLLKKTVTLSLNFAELKNDNHNNNRNHWFIHNWNSVINLDNFIPI